MIIVNVSTSDNSATVTSIGVDKSFSINIIPCVSRGVFVLQDGKTMLVKEKFYDPNLKRINLLEDDINEELK